jgi:hypothetical protein
MANGWDPEVTRRPGGPSMSDLGVGDIADSGREAHEMRELGFTYRDIAKDQGVSVKAAHYRVKWYETYLAGQLGRLGR